MFRVDVGRMLVAVGCTGWPESAGPVEASRRRRASQHDERDTGHDAIRRHPSWEPFGCALVLPDARHRPLAGCLAMPHVVVRRTLDEHRSIAMTTLEDRAWMHPTHRIDCVT
jgi:hypothetical protein